MAPDLSGAKPEPRGATREATRSAIERYMEMLNAHDPEQIAACVTDDFLNEHTSRRGRTLRGRAAYRDRLRTFLAEFEDLSYQVEDVVVDEDRAAVCYVMRARWRIGAPASTSDGSVQAENGRPVALRGMFWFRVEGGLVAHRRDYWDGEDFASQVAAAGDPDVSEATVAPGGPKAVGPDAA
ncbi:MAG TPA: nuclear transport factor 2 family protein [Acidimicrobiales bacterium]|nr:nuclear transport factor 2 family protein [Acidimicrobiales bacterium]